MTKDNKEISEEHTRTMSYQKWYKIHMEKMKKYRKKVNDKKSSKFRKL
jgi:hypothetical protein